MPYRTLTDERRREILAASLLQVETEHYELSVRLEAYDGAVDVSPENKAEMVRQTRDRLASLEAAMEVYAAKLSELGVGAENGA